MKPRVLFVGRTRYRLPLDDGLARKWDALSELLDLRVVASGTGTEPRFRLVPPRPLDGPRFYTGLPLVVASELRSFRPDVVVAESPYEAAAVLVARPLGRSDAKLLAEVHGDWRTSTRLYGSPFRRLASPFADAVAGAALRRADAVRTISPYTTGLVREAGLEPVGEFATYADLGVFTDRPAAPLPDPPAALFVGVLERYKNVDGLARAWRIAAPQVPSSRLVVVGRGSLTGVVRDLVAELPGQTEWIERLPPAGVAEALDASTCLVLPSRSEGLGRVLVEAFLRGRPAVAMGVGGIRDVVEDGVSGILVSSDAELATALVRLLTAGELAERLAAGAAAAGPRWASTAAEYAQHVRAAVDATVGR